MARHEVYKNQVAIRVWRNVKFLGKLPTSHFGHASLTARGLGAPRIGGESRLQISFWPSKGAGIGMSGVRRQKGSFNEDTLDDKVAEIRDWTALRLEVGYRDTHEIPVPESWRRALQKAGASPLSQTRPGQRRLGVNLIKPRHEGDEPELVDGDSMEGIPLYSQSPEVKIVLPGFNNQGRMWGLSISRITAWWGNFVKSDPMYCALSKQNCAGIVLQALHEGGATAIAEMPRITLYAEPRQVEAYARALQAKMEQMEDAAQKLDAEIRQRAMAGTLKADTLGDLRCGLWSVARWKELSALGPLKPRSSIIRAIDEALALYHTADWVKGYHIKWHALVQIFLNIAQHRAQKVDSERTAAVLLLGQQVLSLLRNPGGHM